jgi:hypothetical protein
MTERAITWADRIANLQKALGREPTLEEMLDASQIHQMTPEVSEKPQLNRCLQRLHDKARQPQSDDDEKQFSSRHSQVSFAG